MPRQPYVPAEESVYRPFEHKISAKGVAPDLPIEAIGDNFLSSALNFVVRNGRVQKRDGYQRVTTTDASATTIVIPSTSNGIFEFVSPSNGATLIFSGLVDMRAYIAGATAGFTVSDGLTHDPGFQDANFFTSIRTASSGFRVVHVNGRNNPSWWTGATGADFVTLTTAVVGACAIAWKSHLLQGDTTDTADGHLESRIHWSALGSPAVWTGTASAGNIDLTDANGTGVQNMIPLRTVLAVYKEEAVHALVYKASPLYYTQSLLHPTLSTVSRRAICTIENGERHFVLTKEGAIIWDGQTVKPIGANRVDKTILAQIHWPFRQRCWAAWNAGDREICLGINLIDNTMKVWIYNLDYDAWWETNYNFWAMAPAQNFFNTPRMVATIRDTNRILLPFQGEPADDITLDAFSCSLQTGLYDYGAMENKGLMQMAATFSPGTGSSVTVSISKSSQANPLITPSFTSAQSMTSTGGAALQKIDFRRSERWLGYRLTEGASTNRLVVDRLIPYVTERTNTRVGRS